MERVTPEVARYRAQRVDMHPIEHHWFCACGVAGSLEDSVHSEPWCPTFKKPQLYAISSN